MSAGPTAHDIRLGLRQAHDAEPRPDELDLLAPGGRGHTTTTMGIQMARPFSLYARHDMKPCTRNELIESMNGAQDKSLVLKKGAHWPKCSTKSHWIKTDMSAP
jgi:hypothetical protein